MLCSSENGNRIKLYHTNLNSTRKSHSNIPTNIKWVEIELDLVAILIALSSATISLVSLSYAAKQRNIVKHELVKKHYLENAQTNLTEVIERLRKTELPKIDETCDLRETIGDSYWDANVLTQQILIASFESKKTKIMLEVSYELKDYGKTGELDSEAKTKTTSDFSQSSPKLLYDLFKLDRAFSIESNTVIPDYQRNLGNEIHLDLLEWGLRNLVFAIDKLTNYEEVYETVSANIMKFAIHLLEETTKEVFKVISEPKKVEVDLRKFSRADDITKYLFETYLNYGHISKMLSQGISELDSKLTEARKELFLRISH
jgi:hypothetical protein